MDWTLPPPNGEGSTRNGRQKGRLFVQIGLGEHEAPIRSVISNPDDTGFDLVGLVGTFASGDSVLRVMQQVLTEAPTNGVRHLVLVVTTGTLWANYVNVPGLMAFYDPDNLVHVTFVVVGDLDEVSPMAHDEFVGLNELDRLTVRVATGEGYPEIVAQS